MGNLKSKNYTFMEDISVATEEELTNTECFPLPIYNLEKYVGTGNNFQEALEDLKTLCYKHGVPKPEKYEDIYTCGTIDFMYLTTTKMKINPVFHKERNDRHFAITYYPIM